MKATRIPHYSVLAPLDQLRPKDERLPANMKLVPWFQSSHDDASVADACANAVGSIEPFYMTGGAEAHYSSEVWRRSRVIGERAWFSALHTQILDGINNVSPEFLVPEHVGSEYIPHVSVPDLTKAGSRRWIRRGETIGVDELWVVRHDLPQMVLRKVGLGSLK